MEVRDLFESMDYGAAPESPDQAREWLDRRKGILDHFIGGEWVTPAGGEYFSSHNPATGELLATVADGNEADVNRAVAAAADALEGATGELFALLAREAGKTLPDAIAELREAVDFLRYYAAEAERLEQEDPGTPRGVFVCISPWNFPLAIYLGQITAALVAGNTVLRCWQQAPARQAVKQAARDVAHGQLEDQNESKLCHHDQGHTRKASDQLLPNRYSS